MFAIICGESFRSKAALKRRVQSILNDRLGPTSIDDHCFLVELFQRHPSYEQKRGQGIVMIRVVLAMPYRTRCFEIERIDGTTTDISYLECLTPSTVFDWFPAACRTAVVSQIQAAKDAAFGDATYIACPITGQRIDRRRAHVDHAPPWTFDAIVEAFIDQSVIDIAQVAFVDVDGGTESKFADVELEEAFAEFHRKHATLRVVSRMANLSVLRRSE